MKAVEMLAEELKRTLGKNLRSVVLYGSAATEDQTKRFSDINVLAVVGELNLLVLKSALPVIRSWVRRGQPAPLFFTEEHMREAQDVFPIEFMSMRVSHRLIYGNDPFADFQLSPADLRRQLEFELRSKLIQLRQRYLETGGNKKQLLELLERAISSFSVLFQAVLVLIGEKVPSTKNEVVKALSQRVSIDAAALEAILSARNDDKNALRYDPEDLLERLIKSVEAVVQFVDRHK